MSMCGILLRGFGGAGTSAGTLAVADNGDGTGATATIAGTTSGSTNLVRVYSLVGVLIGTFTRSGNGALALALATGQYSAVLISNGAAQDGPVFFSVTSQQTVVDHAELLCVLLSYSTTWQALCSAANAAAALAYTHRYEVLNTATFPYALVQDDPLWSSPVATGISGGGGTLILSMFLTLDAATYTTRQARRDYLRAKVLLIKREMEVLSNSRATPAGYSVSHLVTRKITLLAPPSELKASQVPVTSAAPPLVWGAEFSVEW